MLKPNWHNLCIIAHRMLTDCNTMKSIQSSDQNRCQTMILSIQSGFTLIEMMIVVSIIGILVAIAIPSYQTNISNARSHACLSESKSYSNNVLYTLNDQDDSTVPIAPTLGACQSITDAIGWTLQTQKKIIAIAKPPSNARIECDIPNGSPCRIMP